MQAMKETASNIKSGIEKTKAVAQEKVFLPLPPFFFLFIIICPLYLLVYYMSIFLISLFR